MSAESYWESQWTCLYLLLCWSSRLMVKKKQCFVTSIPQFFLLLSSSLILCLLKSDWHCWFCYLLVILLCEISSQRSYSRVRLRRLCNSKETTPHQSLLQTFLQKPFLFFEYLSQISQLLLLYSLFTSADFLCYQIVGLQYCLQNIFFIFLVERWTYPQFRRSEKAAISFCCRSSWFVQENSF